jgi:hypothetical protein
VPSSQSAKLGGRASFRVLAAGTGPLQYLWSRETASGFEPLDVTGDTLRIDSAKEEDFVKYQVSITGPLGGTPVTVTDFLLKKVDAGPEILTQPEAVASRVGQTVTLRVEMKPPVADGLTYSWFFTDGMKEGTPVTGGTSSSLTLANLASKDTGYYYVVVSDVAAATMSLPALVFVNEADPIGLPKTEEDIAQRKAQQTLFANEGETVTLRSYAIGDGFRYAWRRLDGKPITATSRGVDGPTLVLRNVSPADAAEYITSISLADGTKMLDIIPWKVVVIAAPVFLDGPTPGTKQQPESQVRLPGETAILSAGVVVTGDTRFQWFFRPTGTSEWLQMPGATTSTTRVERVTNADDGDYRLEVRNAAATISSEIARVTVLRPVVATGVSVSPAAVNPGGDVTLTASWTGALLESKPFQWYVQDNRTRGWKVLEGQNEATLVVRSVTEANDANYKVRISGKVGGFVESAPVRLVVNDPVGFPTGLKVQTMALVVGERTAFTAAATGFSPGFQWHYRRDLTQPWTPLTGASAQSAVFQTGPVTADMGGLYGVTLSNAFSVAGASKLKPSEPYLLGRLTVYAPPQFVSPELTVSGAGASASNALAVANEGGAIILSGTIRSDSTVPVSYSWRKNGVQLPTTQARPTFGQTVVVPSVLTLEIPNIGREDAGRYELLVSNAYGVTASTPVNVSVRLKPRITRDPVSLTVVHGSSASFRVDAEGDDVSYQWFRGTLSGGTLRFDPFFVPGTTRPATGPLLAFTSLDSTSELNGAVFQAVASNSFASAASAPARLVIAAVGDLKITEELRVNGLTNGVALPAAPGQANPPQLSLSIQAEGSGALTYLWRKDGVTLGSGTGNTFNLGTATNNSAGVYDVVISNEANFVYSTPVTLVVDPYLASFSVPAGGAVGDGLRLEAIAVSSKQPTYKWRFRSSPTADSSVVVDSADVSGSAAAVLLLKSAKISDTGEYQVEVATADAMVLSNWMPLTVVTKVDIDRGPKDFAGIEGAPAEFSVVAKGGGTIKYRWFKDGLALPGADQAVLRIGSLTLADAGNYQAEVSNAAGGVMSEPARLSVEEILAVSVQIPGRVVSGQGVSLLAAPRGVKTGRSLTYQWYRGAGASRVAIAGESKAQLIINPVSTTDVGIYSVELSDGVQQPVGGQGVLALSVAPQLRASLANQTVPVGAKVAFAVAVKYAADKQLVYEWSRGNTKLPGVTGEVLRIASVTTTDFGTYTVRVSDAADPTVFVETSAKLVQAVGATPSTLTGATGAEGTLAAADFAPWWVFDVSVAGSTGANAALNGFWLLERKQVLEAGKVVAVTAGRSAWIWPDRSVQETPVWSADELQVTDGATNAQAEFSVIASKEGPQLNTFVLEGSVELAGAASIYGAPELLSGGYDVDRSLDVDLFWAQSRVDAVEAVSDWNTVLNSLKTELSAAKAAVPRGD